MCAQNYLGTYPHHQIKFWLLQLFKVTHAMASPPRYPKSLSLLNIRPILHALNNQPWTKMAMFLPVDTVYSVLSFNGSVV
jgi:hypothetical protein